MFRTNLNYKRKIKIRILETKYYKSFNHSIYLEDVSLNEISDEELEKLCDQSIKRMNTYKFMFSRRFLGDVFKLAGGSISMLLLYRTILDFIVNPANDTIGALTITGYLLELMNCVAHDKPAPENNLIYTAEEILEMVKTGGIIEDKLD